MAKVKQNLHLNTFTILKEVSKIVLSHMGVNFSVRWLLTFNSNLIKTNPIQIMNQTLTKMHKSRAKCCTILKFWFGGVVEDFKLIVLLLYLCVWVWKKWKIPIIESLDFQIWGNFQICVFENLDQNLVLLLWYEIMVVDRRHAYESHQMAIIHNRT
jgi:hypothetical protein